MSFKDEPIDIKEFMARYTTDLIGSCAFGVECNSFKEPEPEFRRYGRKVSYITKLRHFQRFFATSFPDFSRTIGISTIPKEVSSIFMGMISNVIERRRELGIRRNDVLQILIDINRESTNKQNSAGGAITNGFNQTESAKKPLTMNEIASNSFIFFVAGFETAANTLAFSFYELSRHQSIQDRIRDEIKDVLVKHDGQITYELLFEMKYLRQVLDGTLRKYPITPTMKRKCTEGYKISGKRFGLMQMMIGVVRVLLKHRVKLSPKMAEHMEFEPNAFIVMTKGSVWVELKKI